MYIAINIYHENIRDKRRTVLAIGTKSWTHIISQLHNLKPTL